MILDMLRIYKMRKYIIGIFIGLLLPVAFDWVAFGSPTPCETVTRYEDGSSIQQCKVKE